jgi:hypothetical protein
VVAFSNASSSVGLGGGDSSPNVGTYGFSSSGSGGSKPAADTSAGKFNLDLTDPGSLTDIASSGADLIGKVGGGALGLIGQLGIPGGPTLGDAPKAIGAGLGAVGGISLPYLGNDPTRTNAHLGDVPGFIGNVLSTPEKAVERTVAGQRVEHAQSGSGVFNEGLPPDLQAKLDAGASVNEVADELVARNAGFTNNPILNIGAGIIFDPLNLIAPGAGKVGALAGKFGEATRTAEEASKLGLGERFVGSAYNGLTRGLPASAGAAMDHVMGGTTSAIFHSLGTKPYIGIKSGLSKISEDAAGRFDEALGKGSTQMAVAAAQDEIGREVQHGYRAAESATLADVQAQMSAMKSIRPDRLARKVENLLDRTAPNLSGLKGQAARDWAIPRVAEIAGISVEDAGRVLGKNLGEKDLQTIHLAFYGRAGGDLAGAKASLVTDEAAHGVIPRLDDLTVISESHLTQERADNLLAALKRGDPAALEEAGKYDALQRYVAGSPESVTARLKDILPKIKSSLPEAVRLPKTGKNPLPGALSEWRAKYAPLGYDLGFGPKSGVKVLEDAGGKAPDMFVAPFVHFVDEADKLTARNPLGRAMDGMFRGITQTKIIATSRSRMVREGQKFGLSEAEAKAFHQTVIGQAVERGENVRGLRPVDYQQLLRDTVGEERFHELRQKFDPTYLVMKSFEGDLKGVGLTQKISGKAKVATADKGNIVATIAEGIYPKFRFTLSPVFQAQELIESPILNAMRGVRPVKMIDPEVEKLYGSLLELSPEYRTLEGAEYVTRLAGGEAAKRAFGPNTLIGKALSRFDVQGTKEANRVAQIASENPDAFESAVKEVNPSLWRAMSEAYGTTDATEITRRYVEERMVIAGNARGLGDTLTGDVIRAGRETESADRNAAIGVARGGTFESGGAMRPISPAEMYAKAEAKVGRLTEAGAAPEDIARAREAANAARDAAFHATDEPVKAVMDRIDAVKPTLANADEETVWQAFRSAFEESAQQAFTTHYFNPQRGWLERSLNHPYLGLYPLSYMWGKMIPEFARFLLARPFGLNAPLVGYAAAQRVQQGLLASLATDPDGLGKFIKDNQGTIYLANLMLPATPTDFPVNAPAYLRHAVTGKLGGNGLYKKGDITGRLGGEAQDLLGNLGPVRDVRLGLDAGGDVADQLQKTAAMLDGMFPRH